MKKWYLWLGILLILTILWRLFAPVSHFDVEVARLKQMNRCFDDLQIPCRWTPDLGLGYGSPTFNYLPPLPYYFGELIYLLSGNINFAVIFLYLLPFVSFLFSIWVFIRFIKEVNTSNMLLLAISTTVLLLSHTQLSIIFLSLIIFWVILQKKGKKFVFILFCSLVISISLSSFYIVPAIFERNLVHQEFLPIYATEAPREAAKERFRILTGDSQTFDFKQGSNWLKFKTKTKTHTIIRLSQHYFPNWKIFVDGKETQLEYKNNSLGLMTIILGEGEHTIEGRIFDTPVRTVSNIVTVASFILILILFLYQNKFFKKWIAYYKKGVSD